MPPSGFLFSQPETGWSAPQWLSFQDTVLHIIRHRKANPRFNLATDIETVEWELEAFTIKRLQSMKGVESYLLDNGNANIPPKPNFQEPPRAKSGVAVEAVKRTAAGVGILLEWLGDGGKPVAPELASERAKTCSSCPENKRGNLGDFFTTQASEIIRKQLEIKNDLKLSTAHDGGLHICAICLCPLKLKVHTPIQHIQEHTSAEVEKQLPTHCWMVKEFTHK